MRDKYSLAQNITVPQSFGKGPLFGVGRIVPCTLEDDMGTTNGMNNGGETRLSQDNICHTTSSVSGTLCQERRLPSPVTSLYSR